MMFKEGVNLVSFGVPCLMGYPLLKQSSEVKTERRGGIISCLHRLKPMAINLLSMIGIEWGVPICSRAHKKETPHDVGDIFYFTIVQIVWAVVGWVYNGDILGESNPCALNLFLIDKF